ncbi:MULTISPECIES: beta-L-arabinofuranosidase domain-containing protein [unclassified Arthrobacter]|nr:MULTISPECIES: beta-L-arabinofuranosidase domain-containing protein [unclassified Arthrobacter]
MKIATNHLQSPVAPLSTLLHPLDVSEARLMETGFWGTRSRINASNTLPHCLGWLERAGWLPNFDLAAQGRLPVGRKGREFADSEVYKLLEAYCWENANHPSAELENVIVEMTRRISAAQENDGYLNTQFGRPGQHGRYSDLEWGHELYNYGHLLQAAVARLRSHGEDALVAVARRVANHICETFGEDGIQSVCGHPEIELGLLEFARATGNDRYRHQAQLFIDRRGHGHLADIEWGRSYFQDDVPVREATVLRGHAVRALYLAAAVVDLAVDTDDKNLLSIMETQWENTVASRTYITGGMGSHHQDEAFGEDYELPSDRAYCESCAGVASVMFSWRLLLATGNSRYADLIERTMFNIVATASADDGRSFFYSNTLHRRSPGEPTDPTIQSKRADSSQRSAWFDVACCPNNIARTLASLGSYLATRDGSGIQIHQYADAELEAVLASGNRVKVGMTTRYPDDGSVFFTVLETPTEPWTIAFRIPKWAGSARISVHGKTFESVPGYAQVTKSFTVGDQIHVMLPIEPRAVDGNPRIDAVRGAIALEAGPLVYCLESASLPNGIHVDDFVAETLIIPAPNEDATLRVQGHLDANLRTSWPYGTSPQTASGKPLAVDLIPYHAWGNRGPVSMRIWLRTH